MVDPWHLSDEVAFVVMVVSSCHEDPVAGIHLHSEDGHKVTFGAPCQELL